MASSALASSSASWVAAGGLRDPLMSGQSVHSAILPFLGRGSVGRKEVADRSSLPESMALVREEAQLIAEILDYMSTVSAAEVRKVFCQTRVEAHLAEALCAGGAAGGGGDAARMLEALRSAADAGSIWAPLWLGDLEHVQEKERVDGTGDDARRRGWYNEAFRKGHPQAAERLAALPPNGGGADVRMFFAGGSQFFFDRGDPSHVGALGGRGPRSRL